MAIDSRIVDGNQFFRLLIYGLVCAPLLSCVSSNVILNDNMLAVPDSANKSFSQKQIEEQVTTSKAPIVERIRHVMAGKPASISAGKLNNGTLQYPSSLWPPEGEGYYLAHPNRGSHYGHDRMVAGLLFMGAQMTQRFGEESYHRIRIHDISNARGGKIGKHINHQLGLDVDIAFYATNIEGEPIDSVWVSYNSDGVSNDGMRLFDVDRNWALIEEMITSPYFGSIRSILVADNLKHRLLAYAKQKKAYIARHETNKIDTLEAIIVQAEALMREPKSSPHNNHFHLSLSIQN